MNEAVPMQVLLAGVRGYFWDFERVTPFPVPALLKNLPEDGTEMIAPEDPAGDHAEVRAALATGNLSLEAVPAPTTNPSEASDSPLAAACDGVNDAKRPGGSPAGSALHMEAVGVVSPSSTSLKPSSHAKERHVFGHQESFNGNDSFMSARSSLDHALSFGSAVSANGSASASTSGGEVRDGRGVPAAESGRLQLGSPTNPLRPNQTTPSGITRGVFTDMSGDSGAISLPCPP